MTDAGEQSICRIVLEALPVGVYAVNHQGKGSGGTPETGKE
jgi:hypothetical protein